LIVVDTNILVYSLIQGPATALARRVLDHDPVIRLPELWRHEFVNALATYSRSGGATAEEARQLWLEADRLFEPYTVPVDLSMALEFAVRHRITAYDAQFIALAEALGVRCVTEDRRLQKQLPRLAVSMEAFCGR
jgi:predicted nucleic acid-binding protein